MLPGEKLESLENLLREEGVPVAYLYGSYATDREHGDSDVDIGILVDEIDFDFKRVQKLERKLSKSVQEEVDLRVLNGRETRFVYNVLREAELIFSEDEGLRADFEQETMRNYFDMIRFYEQYDSYVQERVTT